jgi:predicted dehydrogenase
MFALYDELVIPSLSFYNWPDRKSVRLRRVTASLGVLPGRFDFPAIFQQKLQIEDFARCILENKHSIVKGDEGPKDMLIIDAILESIRTSKKVRVESPE